MGKASKLLVHCPKCMKEIGINEDKCKYCGFSMKDYRNELLEEETDRKGNKKPRNKTKDDILHMSHSKKTRKPNVEISTRLSPMMSVISAISAFAICVALLIWINSLGFSLIRSVKGARPYAYPDITYEEAFNDFFVNPHWENASSGREKIVRFTGEYKYEDTKIANIIINYRINDDNTLDLIDGKVNGVSLNNIELAQINSIPFAQYKK